MKEIKGYSHYYITDDGKVFSKARGNLREIKSRVDSSTYLRIMLYDGLGGNQTCLVHRLVAQAYIPNPDNLPCINHKDGNKLNNHVSNLEWCTYSYNMKHALDTKLRRSNDGMGNPRNILTEESVLEIYQKLLDGRRDKDIADEYGVKKATIFSIKSKQNWSYLTNALPDIPREKRNHTKLSDNTVKWICNKLVDGLTAPQIVELSTNPNVTVDRVWDIKRRRCYKTISENYNF